MVVREERGRRRHAQQAREAGLVVLSECDKYSEEGDSGTGGGGGGGAAKKKKIGAVD